jgi:hypothetical protein
VSQAVPSSPAKEPFDFIARLREIDMFFEGTSKVHDTTRRVAGKLEAAGIPYAIVGGMAVNAHKHERTTKDVDFLLTSAGIDAFRRLYVGPEFDPVPGRPRRFVDRANGITFDILVTGLFPGNGKPQPVSFPDPDDVAERIQSLQVVDLATLIELKLAARRYQDFADVVNLIAANNLDELFLEQIEPSVRGDYIECLEEKRREDEYEARQDEAFERRAPSDDAPPSP